MNKAVVLLSGGLDSATALAVARRDGRDCYPLTVLYGQRHDVEVNSAMDVADSFGLDTHIVRVPALGELAHSALTADIAVPKDRAGSEIANGIPATYVPGRNTVLLALALACAESIDAQEIWTGFNVLDASGYPDCRPAFIHAFEALAQVATRSGGFTVHAPLIDLTKAQIIALGQSLGVDYALTHSCYDPQDGAACGRCDACALRRKGFAEAGVPDPTRYVEVA
jgi:7-cyano-7-deazaguanine synthase